MFAISIDTDDLRRQVDEGVHRRVRELAVELRGDLVELRGRADSYHVKQLAQEAALPALPAGWRLENRIRVGEASAALVPSVPMPLFPLRRIRPGRIVGRPLLVGAG